MSQQIDKILQTILPNNNLPQFKQQITLVNEMIQLLDSHINNKTMNEDVQLYIPCDVKLSLLNKQLCELRILLESHTLANTIKTSVNHSREFITDMSKHMNKLCNDYMSLYKYIEDKIKNINSDDIEAKIKCLQSEEFKILEQMTASQSKDLLIKLLQIKNCEQFFQEKYQDKQYLSKSLIIITQKLDILKDMKSCIESEIPGLVDTVQIFESLGETSKSSSPLKDTPDQQSIVSIKEYLKNIPQVDEKIQPFSNPMRQTSANTDLFNKKFNHTLATNNKNSSIRPSTTNGYSTNNIQSMNGFTSYLQNTDLLDQMNYEHLPKYELKHKSTDLNKDITLRKKVIKYYRNHLIKWIKNENIDISESIKTDHGITKIYSLLKEYVKENNVNWYDLRDHHNDIKKFIKQELF